MTLVSSDLARAAALLQQEQLVAIIRRRYQHLAGASDAGTTDADVDPADDQ